METSGATMMPQQLPIHSFTKCDFQEFSRKANEALGHTGGWLTRTLVHLPACWTRSNLHSAKQHMGIG